MDLDTQDSKQTQQEQEVTLALQKLQREIKHQQNTTKNAIKLSIIVAIICFFFVALNFSILFTLAGGIAGSDRKLNTLQQENQHLKEMIQDLQATSQKVEKK